MFGQLIISKSMPLTLMIPRNIVLTIDNYQALLHMNNKSEYKFIEGKILVCKTPINRVKTNPQFVNQTV